MNDVKLDFDRENRTGIAEAVFCQRKSLEQLKHICSEVVAANQSMLFTKLSKEMYLGLSPDLEQDFFDYDEVSMTAFHHPEKIPQQEQETGLQVAVVSGGTSDALVAREASRTLAFYGHNSLAIDDVGVAGLWRITERLDELHQCKIIICVAGMDAALPTVLGGLVSASIIAVPTSVGYGVAREGETALNALLVSCASGLVVVNIDNGYGAACAAIRILNNW